MKYIALSLLTLFTSCTVLGEQMDHPIFGYTYDTQQSKYEPVSPDILNRLDITSKGYWIYATTKVSEEKATYIIVGGLIANHSDGEVDAIEYASDFGALIRIKENTIDILGTPDVLLNDDMNLHFLKENLIKDAIDRSIHAEGIEDFKKNISINEDPFIKKLLLDRLKISE